MGEFTHGVEAEVNGMNGLTLGVETLEERIAPWVVGDVGVGVGVATSVGEIRERTQQKFGAAPTPDVVEGFVATLGRLGLLETMEAGHAASAPQSRRLRGGLLHLRLSAFDPDPLLERLVGPVRLCFTPYFVGVSLLVMLVALAIVIGRRAEIARDLHHLYRVETVLLAWLAIVVVATAHEFAHGLT